MTSDELNPVAEMLIESYYATAQHSIEFRNRWKTPPNTLEKAQYLRSVMTALLMPDEAFKLHPEYLEFGRLHFTDLNTNYDLLLRSKSAITVERNLRQRESLFDPTHYIKTNTTILVCEFEPEALVLSVAGAHHRSDRRRLEPTGKPSFVGRWPYGSVPTPPPGIFDQGIDPTVDPFDEVGSLDIDGKEGQSE